MANTLTGRIAVLLAGVLFLISLGFASGDDAATSVRAPSARFLEHAAPLDATRVAQAAPSFRGGPITTPSGEVVDVRVSDSLPPETATPEGWAQFIGGLTHGAEITALTTFVVSFAEVQEICGSRALGCYGGNRMVVPGEVVSGISPEEVVRHEYGHHIAFHRTNAPWAAIDWGPKRWASAASICAKVSRREAYPGDQGSNYARNPGEAWAETYRLMDERKAGISTASWPIIAPSFFPDDARLAAAEQDVVAPWTAQRTTTSTRVFGKRTPKAWLLPVTATLDGDYRISATLPNGGTYDVTLVGSDRHTVLKRAQWVGQRVKRVEGSICGQRGLFVRVTQKTGLGRVRISVTTP
ncbi:MAG TPA: hypothetical protein VFU99_04980 [Gaiellaceae bacterium]|nr:hypothetical protein [Gaiellaceae bacterium]